MTVTLRFLRILGFIVIRPLRGGLCWGGLLACLLGLGAVGEVAAAAPVWKTGAAWQQQWALPVTIEWQGVALRGALENLAQSQGVATLIDRRLNPSRKLSVSIREQPLRQACEQIAETQGFGVCVVGPVTYWGPPTLTTKLTTLSALMQEQLAKRPAATRVAWNKSVAWKWDDLATPRDLLTQLSREGNVTWQGLEHVPHDLWGAADLPPLPLYERALLVAAQFDLTLDISADGSSAALVPIPARVAIERRYPATKEPSAVVARFKSLAPEAEIEVHGNQLIVRATLDDHQRLSAPKSAAAPVTNTPGVQVYTLTLSDVPLDKLLTALEGRLMIRFQLDRAAIDKAQIKLDQNVSLKVQQVSLDELLRAALEPAGLTFRRQGETVEVLPKPKP